jgi:predicted ArsR family transcriptional regulator
MEEGRAHLQHTALASPVRREMLELIRESATPLDAAQLAERLALHVTTSRFHLGQLEAAGLVVRELAPTSKPGRPKVTFRAAPEAAEVVALRELATVLASALAGDADGGAARAHEAGRAWARQHPPTQGDDRASALTRAFTELGFEPVPEEQGRIDLHACPFRDLAREHPKVVCMAHAGLMSGIVGQLGTEQGGAELKPFVEPELCVVRLQDQPQPDPQPAAGSLAEAERRA